MSEELFDFDVEGFQKQVTELIVKLDRMAQDVDEGALSAARESAEVIAREQKRLLSAADFAHPTANLAGLIRVRRDKRSKYYRLSIGYDSEAIRQHPEVLVIEFGRPGKSARRMSPTEQNFEYISDGRLVKVAGRRKGNFPPQTPHIIAGYLIARNEAAQHFQERMLEIARRRWENGG